MLRLFLLFAAVLLALAWAGYPAFAADSPEEDARMKHWRSCSKDAECVLVPHGCNSNAAVVRKHEKNAQRYYWELLGQDPAALDCADMKKFGLKYRKKKKEALCIHGMCDAV